MTDIIEGILELFEKYGHNSYGEEITIQEHMLQTALLAQQEGVGKPLIAAALLHDIGHLIIDKENLNGSHEEIGADFLSQYFYEDITGPIRFHVRAKRYKCAKDPEYVKNFSPESIKSLEQQGGPLSEYDMRNFEYHFHFVGSVRLRNWDDKAKVPGVETLKLEEYIPCLKLGMIK